MKTAVELNVLKNEVESLNDKLSTLSEEELTQVTGGVYQGACFVYVIEKGDTIEGIAERFGTTVKILCELNNIHRLCEQLYPGNKLLVPCN